MGFGIEVEDCALVVEKLGCVAQYLAIDKRCSDNGCDIEYLFNTRFEWYPNGSSLPLIDYHSRL